MEIPRLGAALEFAYPWLLLLVPLVYAFWLWLRHWPHVVQVGSTFLWHRVAARRHHPRGPWSWWIVATLLAIAAARPELVATIPAPPTFRITLAPGPSAVPYGEVVLPSSTSGSVEVRLEMNGALLVADRWDITGPDEAARRWALPPSVLDGDRVRARVNVAGTRRTLWAGVPPRWQPLPVRDETGSATVARALAALESRGWVRRSTADARLHVTTMVPAFADAIVVRGGGATLFPVPELPIGDHPLLDGLDARRWTIERAHVMEEAERVLFPEVILDSDTGPLIAAGERGYWLAFDPTEASIGESAAWPVLLGRMVASRSPSRVTPASHLWPERTPQWSLLVLAALVILLRPSALPTGRHRLWTLLLIAVALSVPDIFAGTPRRVVLDADDPTATILERARSADVVVVPDTMNPVLEESELLEVLATRRVGLEVDGRSRRALAVSPDQLELGGRVVARVDTGFRKGHELTAVAPDGARTPLTLTSAGTAEFQPPAGGHWYFQLTDETGSIVASPSASVLDGIAVLRISTGTGAGARALVRDSTFRVSNWRSDAPLAEQLPGSEPDSAPGIVLWDDVDPATLSADDVAALRRWVEDGGTCMTALAPPFHEASERKNELSSFLPAALPDAPRNEEVALGIILLDLSGSMASGQALETVTRATLSLLESTPRGGRWGVATFRETPRWIAPPGTPVTREIIEATARLEAGGGTRLDRGLDFVLSEFQAVDSGRTLVLMTDGRVGRDRGWSRYREQLESAQVEMWAAAIGERADATPLRRLLPRTGGGLVRLANPGTAARSLSDAISTPRGPWRPLEGELRRTTLDPLVAAVPSRLPSPRRWLPTIPHRDSHSLIVSATGQPVLLERSVGSGRTLAWSSGFDADSLPAGYAGARIVSALSSVLVAATRTEPLVRRRVEVRESALGGHWLTIERNESTPTATGFIGSANRNTASPVHFVARTRDHLSLPAPTPHLEPRWVSIDGARHGVDIDPHERARTWHLLANRARVIDSARWRTSSGLSLLALLAIIGMRLVAMRRGSTSRSGNRVPPSRPLDASSRTS